MGSSISCFHQSKNTSKQRALKERLRSREKFEMQDQVFYQQLLLHSQSLRSHSQSYYRSSSSRFSYSKQDFCRSASARCRSTGDAVVPQSQQILSKLKESGVLESKKFVLIHGGGFGAWCWYKSIALLEEAGFVSIALDLSASGIDQTSPKEVMSLEHYAKPLSNYLEKLADHEKVYLVGHSFGGACISYAMEHYPQKIAKAVFVAGAMVQTGQSASDAFSSEVARSKFNFEHANGKISQPTSIELDKSHYKDLLFNRSSSKDTALAKVCVRPVPFAPFVEKLVLTEENYGSVRRFFIQTADDQVLSSAAQERMIKMNPPEQVLKVKGSDHCPFFSKPVSLHELFMEVVEMEPKK